MAGVKAWWDKFPEKTRAGWEVASVSEDTLLVAKHAGRKRALTIVRTDADQPNMQISFGHHPGSGAQTCSVNMNKGTFGRIARSLVAAFLEGSDSHE